MKVKNIVCSPEQAKKLKDLGILQDSLYYFALEPITHNWTVVTLDMYFKPPNIFAAYCDTELAVMLDAFYETYRTENNKWLGGNLSIENEADTPAQATAAHLIHLLETDERLTVAIANERLLNASTT